MQPEPHRGPRPALDLRDAAGIVSCLLYAAFAVGWAQAPVHVVAPLTVALLAARALKSR